MYFLETNPSSAKIPKIESSTIRQRLETRMGNRSEFVLGSTGAMSRAA